MEKLAGDLLLGPKLVNLEIHSTSFMDFLYDKLGKLRSRSLDLQGLNVHGTVVVQEKNLSRSAFSKFFS